MTPAERTMLQDFLGKLTSAKNISKDAEAEALIKRAIAAQPDADYLLVQNILLMQHALTELSQKVEHLEAKLQNAPTAQPQNSFLGEQSENAVKSYFTKPSSQSQAVAPTRPAYQPNRRQGYQAYQNQAPQQYQTPQQSSGMGDFLRSAGTTAAGVAGGMLLFEGVSHLFNGASSFGSIGGIGGHSGFGAATPSVTENITNNYYGSDTSAPTEPADNGFLEEEDISDAFDFGSDASSDDSDLF